MRPSSPCGEPNLKSAAGAAPRREPTISGRRFPHDPEKDLQDDVLILPTMMRCPVTNRSDDHEQQGQGWAADPTIAARVVHDPRMPADPITLPRWAQELCQEEGTDDPQAVAARLMAIKVWASEEGFPAAAIPDPPRIGRGRRPSIYSRALLNAWRAKSPSGHRRPHDPLASGLVDPDRLYTLGGFARAIGVDNKSVTQARDASLRRLGQGQGRKRKGRSLEIPDPEQGAHGVRGAKYQGAALEWWWSHRPGKGRGGGAISHRSRER